MNMTFKCLSHLIFPVLPHDRRAAALGAPPRRRKSVSERRRKTANERQRHTKKSCDKKRRV
jgi:hypothetical protein